MRLRLFSPTVLLVLAIFSSPVRAGMDEALAAIETGDYAAAVAELRPLAEQGVVEAQRSLGLLYFEGIGVPRDAVEAARLFRLAAELGDADAQVYLGGLHQSGDGVPQDFEEALQWFGLAAEQGHPGAQRRLGDAYSYGHGVEQDHEEAVRWYRLAARQGHRGAQFDLAQRYNSGHGVAADPVRAYALYDLVAADEVAPIASTLRDGIAQQLDPAGLAEARRLSTLWAEDPSLIE